MQNPMSTPPPSFGSFADDLRAFGIEIPEALSPVNIRDSIAGEVPRETLMLIGLAALLFFGAEKGRNPSVNALPDALLYCSASLSAGHGHIQPVTAAGKLIGTLLLSLARPQVGGESPVQQQIRDRMEPTAVSP